MNIRTLIDEGLRRLTRRNDNIAKKPRYPPIGGTKTKPGVKGKDICGACGGAIVQVNDRGTRACWKCGKKAQ